jgi:uncharacterized protein YcbX
MSDNACGLCSNNVHNLIERTTLQGVPMLAEIHVYPIKSTKGVPLAHAKVETQGIQDDRRYLIADLHGRMVTGRKYPHLVNVTAQVSHQGLSVTSPGKETLHLNKQDFVHSPVEAKVWSDRFTAYSTTDAANAWFSEIIGNPVQLLYCGEQSQRFRESLATNVSFADGYPLLLISRASLKELNRRCSEKIDMQQFRTNLVVECNEPFEEDSWKKIRIGDVVFEVSKPCERCVFTTVSPTEGVFAPSKEPIKTLKTFRADERGRVFFGQNVVALNEGMITMGDEVEVLEYHPPAHYPDKDK